MKAVFIHEYGDESKLRYEETPTPVPGPRQVLIKVAGASVNRADLSRRQGTYRSGVALNFPIVPGTDIAGVIEAVGVNVRPDEAPIGSPVLALLSDGGYAEYVVTHVAATQPVPENLSLTDAAGIPVVFLTAWFGLLLPDHGALQAGQTVLVNSAGSGVGVAAIQIAKHVGAKVIASAGADWKLERAKELGADEVVNYSTQNLAEEVQRLTNDVGVELVESVGGTIFQQSLEALSLSGRLVNVGSSAGPSAPAADEGELIRRGVQVSSFGLPSQIPGGGARRALGELLTLFREGRLRCVVDRTFPLSQASAAHLPCPKKELRQGGVGSLTLRGCAGGALRLLRRCGDGCTTRGRGRARSRPPMGLLSGLSRYAPRQQPA
ncbi:MAG: zinc-binding dehydrogenase [Chloroflexi bacterium]|nr:zinc-binding dehydrogenase [Chloroflexota bacterium]